MELSLFKGNQSIWYWLGVWWVNVPGEMCLFAVSASVSWLQAAKAVLVVQGVHGLSIAHTLLYWAAPFDVGPAHLLKTSPASKMLNCPSQQWDGRTDSAISWPTPTTSVGVRVNGCLYVALRSTGESSRASPHPRPLTAGRYSCRPPR